MSEYRITRVDLSLSCVVCSYPSLEAAEAFLRENWCDVAHGRPNSLHPRYATVQDSYRIVQWDEEVGGPLAAWRLDYESGDVIEVAIGTLPDA